MDIIGLCGSLRRHSLNRLLLELAGECLPPQATMQVCDWRALPPLDADLLATGMPASVHQLRERIRRADAVVLATPEYNFSIPGMFKNALDWISRGDDQPFRHKPVALVSASPGPLGGARVQYELRKVLQCMEADVLARPEVFVGQAAQKFDSQGLCTDAATRSFVTAQMQALGRLVAQHRRLHDSAQIPGLHD
ncbi:NADPH-dependent FMN reductase [Delftia sp. PE138]|uniref:NADPH-dependent FMN reductase n=1 Tax=Delftia deserti TaxID=1651218 RepID=A0ABW5ET09_9BURK|nr:NADPH-dependent FMN reductase [Delftia sp. PE138]MBS3721523.1 NAD(P)H-dependent FMN reductase [Delftia sp. PE138]